jgi:hypothetical protein
VYDGQLAEIPSSLSISDEIAPILAWCGPDGPLLGLGKKRVRAHSLNFTRFPEREHPTRPLHHQHVQTGAV